MSLALLGSLEVISLQIDLTLWGVWTAEIEVDADDVPLGATSIAIGVEGAAPATFSGTVLESGGFLGRARAFMVGGAGGLRRALPPRQYHLAPPKMVIGDIVREAGEKAGDFSTLEKLSVLPRWVRSAGSGLSSLAVVCGRLGIPWRVCRDGSVRAGPEKWPSYRGSVDLLESNGAFGRALAAQDAPDLEPGLLVEGRRLGRVVHIVAEGGVFRSEIHFERES